MTPARGTPFQVEVCSGFLDQLQPRRIWVPAAAAAILQPRRKRMGLEDGLDAIRGSIAPVAKASLLLSPGELPGLRTSLWMGGAHSRAGEPLVETGLRSAV